MSTNEKFVIRNSMDIMTARMEVRDIARRSGMNLTDQAVISMSVYVLANALGLGKHGVPEGKFQIESCKNGFRYGLKVRCQQEGPMITQPCLSTFEKLVDHIDVQSNNPEEQEVILTIWSKS